MPVRREVSVAVFSGEPYVHYDTEQEKWGGILITVMDTVCGLLEYRCQYVQVPVDGLANETLDGVMGALVNQTADVGVSSLGITIKRSEMFVLMDSMFPRSYYIIIHQDNLISVREYDFFAEAFGKLMSPKLLLVLAVVLLVMSIIGFFIDNWQRLGRLKFFSLVRLGALWIIKLIGLGLGIEGIEDFEVYRFRLWSPSKATFYATWFLYTTVVLSHVSSQLSVVFTFNTPQKVPFFDVRSLYESNFTVYGTPTGIDMMNISQIPYHQKLASRIVPYPRPSGNVTQFQHYLNLSMMPRSALLMNQEALLNLTVLTCEMYLVIDDIGFLRVAGLVLPKGSSFQEGFERGFATAKERGVTAAGFQAYDHYLRTKTSGKVGTCYRKRVKDASLRLPAAQLGNDSFLFLLELLFYGMAVCSFAFFCEHFTQLCYRRKATVRPEINHLL